MLKDRTENDDAEIWYWPRNRHQHQADEEADEGCRSWTRQEAKSTWRAAEQIVKVHTQIGQVVAALFATELFHVHFRAKSSGIQGRVSLKTAIFFPYRNGKK